MRAPCSLRLRMLSDSSLNCLRLHADREFSVEIFNYLMKQTNARPHWGQSSLAAQLLLSRTDSSVRSQTAQASGGRTITWTLCARCTPTT